MKALALLEAPDHVCGRYRVSAFAPSLVAAGWSLAVEGIAGSPLARVRQLRRAGRYDAVILQRKLLPGWQLAILRASCRRLVFDFDDAVLHRDSYDRRGPFSRRRSARFARTVRSVDAVVAGNRFLAKCAADRGAAGDRVRVIPTCVEPTEYQPRFADEPDEGRLRLAWVGSSSTLQGLEARRGLLERIGREVTGVTLRVISDRFPRFKSLAVEAVPWTAEGEADALAASDAGISMLPDDLWSRGKCGLKTLQYGAAGLPTVADPVGVHREMIVPGRSGFLPRSDDEWVGAIAALASDPVRRRRMGREARRKVVAAYSVDAWAQRFVVAITGRDAVPPPNFRRVGRTVRP